ncbi:MAG: glycosyl hydrolase family 28-related protein, partial [Rhodospirillaceae bacterium]
MPRIDDILAAGTAVSKLDLRQYLSSREVANPADYGGVEGGVVDCAPAFEAALAANKAVFVPPGVWRIAAPIALGYGQSLFGVGDGSVIQAREQPFDADALPTYLSDFNAIELQDGYCRVADLKIVG